MSGQVRRLGFDRARLDDKIIEDSDEYLVMPAVIASEIVHQYPDGMAYKAADELEKTAAILDLVGTRPVTVLRHPDIGFLNRAGDVYGRVEQPRYRKDLLDPKTQRPCRNGISANIRWNKRRLPEAILDGILSGALRDVSIGFSYVEDRTPGEWNGQRYDYAQRSIWIDHVAAPVESGRCPGPICGIAVDSLVKIAGDPWEETDEYIRSGHREPSTVCRTKTLSEEEGIKAVICRYGEEWEIQSYLFSKAKGWTMEKAKDWYQSHKGDAVSASGCPICVEVEAVGLEEASKRLAIAYGEDVIRVIKGEPAKREEPPSAPKPELNMDLIAYGDAVLGRYARLHRRPF